MRDDYAPSSLQDVIHSRKRSDFVGREREVEVFRENLYMGVDDPRRDFIYSIDGQGGAGKSYLLGQLRRMADNAGAAVALSDSEIDGVLDPLISITQQLTSGGLNLKRSIKRQEEYRLKRVELLSDPTAPPGLSTVLTSGALGLGTRILASWAGVPELGETVDQYLTPEELTKAKAFVGSKTKSSSDRALLLEPVTELTRLFLSELESAYNDQLIVLFFDTFERRNQALEQWLLDTIEGRYGRLIPNIVITISGREKPEPRKWGRFIGVHRRFQLDVFSEAETRELLSSYGVEDEEVVEYILELSGRLPVLVSMLAQSRPKSVHQLEDPASSAVEQFLRWEDDDRRKVAVRCAFPRTLDEDVISSMGGEAAEDSFSWLAGLVFTREIGGRLRYHEVVRNAMLRVERGRSARHFREQQEALTTHFAKLVKASAKTVAAAMDEDVWADYFLEFWYHRICSGWTDNISQLYISCSIVTEIGRGESYLSRWLLMLSDAARDSGLDYVRDLHRSLSSDSDDREERLVHYLTVLLDSGHLDERWLIRCLSSRAKAFDELQRHEDYLTDSSRLRELDPSSYVWSAQCSLGYLKLNRPRDAISSLSEAYDKNPDASTLLLTRGQLELEHGSLDAAMEVSDSLISKDQETANARVLRARVYRARGNEEEARQELDNVLAEYPANLEATKERVKSLSASEDHKEALNLAKAGLQENRHDSALNLACSTILLEDGQIEEALSYVREAAAAHPEEPAVLRTRGDLERWLGNYSAALESYDRLATLGAVAELDRLRRAELQRLCGSPQESAKQLNDMPTPGEAPLRIWYRYSHVLATMHFGTQHEINASLAALSREIGRIRKSDYSTYAIWFNVALARALMGQPTGALKAFDEFLTYKVEPARRVWASALLGEASQEFGHKQPVVTALIERWNKREGSTF